MSPKVSLLLLAPLWLVFAGCGGLPFATQPRSAADWDGDETLTLIIAELRMDLRDDPYRSPARQTADGRSSPAVLLWKLDRLARERGLEPADWHNVDHVIEFARARLLERLHRYAEAAAAFRRVAESGSILADLAMDSVHVMDAFAAQVGSPDPAPEGELQLAQIEARMDAWRALATQFQGTPRESLAREEIETWQTLRVEWLGRHAEMERAIIACRQLIEQHRDSKRHSQHLIRLGDLYADAARRSRLDQLAKLPGGDARAYEELLANAFAAYELASGDRIPDQRHEADLRIEALMAFHEGAQRAP